MRTAGRSNHRTRDGVLERRCAKCRQWWEESTQYFFRREDPPRWQSPCKQCQRTTPLQKFSCAAADMLGGVLRRLAVVAVFVLSAIATPADAITISKDCAAGCQIVTDPDTSGLATRCHLWIPGGKQPEWSGALVNGACSFLLVIPLGQTRKYTARFWTDWVESADSNELEIISTSGIPPTLAAPVNVILIADDEIIPIPPGGGMSVIATDDFNRANEAPLASPWVMIGGSVFEVVSNQMAGQVAAGGGSAYYNVTTPNDQYVKWKFVGGSTTNGASGLILRNDGTSNVYYLMYYVAASNTLGIVRRNFGNTTIAGPYTYTAAANDVWTFSAVGTLLTANVNGTDVLSVTDATHASGKGGIHSNNGGSRQIYDDFEVGDFTGGGQPAMRRSEYVPFMNQSRR